MDVEPFIRLLVAAGLTALIGVDRELRSKPAGLRTNIVVGTATAAFTYVGAMAFGTGIAADPTRVAAQVVSGIGFLGGGVIFATGGKPHGLTTAAALWGSAAVGVAAGAGAFTTAVALVAITLIALWPLDIVSGWLLDRLTRHTVEVQVVLSTLIGFAAVQAALRGSGVQAFDVDLRDVGGTPVAALTLSGRRTEVADAVEALSALTGVLLIAGGTARVEDE